jgi:hypothetical protein
MYETGFEVKKNGYNRYYIDKKSGYAQRNPRRTFLFETFKNK